VERANPTRRMLRYKIKDLVPLSHLATIPKKSVTHQKKNSKGYYDYDWEVRFCSKKEIDARFAFCVRNLMPNLGGRNCSCCGREE